MEESLRCLALFVTFPTGSMFMSQIIDSSCSRGHRWYKGPSAELSSSLMSLAMQLRMQSLTVNMIRIKISGLANAGDRPWGPGKQRLVAIISSMSPSFPVFEVVPDHGNVF